jgi:hypothetical protein
MRETQKEFGDGMEKEVKVEGGRLHAHPLCLHSRKWKNGDNLKNGMTTLFLKYFSKNLKITTFLLYLVILIYYKKMDTGFTVIFGQ